MMQFDAQKIREAINAIHPNGELFEVRIIAGKNNVSGYFTDADTLLENLNKANLTEKGCVYFTLNAVKEECYSRQQRDCFIANTTTTGDSDIFRYNWVMVDLDPKRASGVSSTNEQLEAAHAMAQKVFTYLHDNGWCDPIVAMSGNGYHLLYKVVMSVTDERKRLMQDVLKTLNMLFADDVVDIDLKTFNPARICKLYGTYSHKGSNTPERPHRLSSIVYVPSVVEATGASFLEKLVSLLPQEEKPQKYNGYNPKEFDLQAWIDKHGIRYSEKTSWNGGTKWILEECLFNAEHKNKDASIIQTSDGKICYNCFHNSCADKRWKDVRLMFEPDAYESKQKNVPNYLERRPTEDNQQQTAPDGTEPVFLTTEQIRLMPTPPEEFIKSGITTIDERLRGFKKGFVTLVSGLRASGKSSLISQFTLEARRNDKKVALYSGELSAKNVLKWLVLQAAGSVWLKLDEEHPGFYLPKVGVEERISKWLDGWVWVYNNDYGNKYDELEKHMEQCVAENGIDLIIIDNLMVLNIDDLDRDMFMRQSKFVGRLEDFAKKTNTHIIFVAHPRKAGGFLRLDDVSGSGDITNRVDNALIMHRVNEDFKRLSKEMFKWKNDDPRYQCSNVIEICKDRDGGTQDEFIPLYFDIKSKRLRNNLAEIVTYDWVDIIDEFTEIDEETPF